MKHVVKKIVVITFIFLLSACLTDAENVVANKIVNKVSVKEALKKGQFELVVDASIIKIKTIKNSSIPVAGTLNFFSGKLNTIADGDLLNLNIDLTSWDSALVERDNNVLRAFFKIQKKQSKSALFRVKYLENSKYNYLRMFDADKSVQNVLVRGFLKYLNKEINVRAKINALINHSARIVVETAEPFKIKISDLGLSDNLNELLALCNYKSVDDEVEVELHLEFSPL